MTSSEALKAAREALHNKQWQSAKEVLAKAFPACANSKYIGDLKHLGVSAMQAGDTDLAIQAFWLTIEIYESGRDENTEVLSAIKLLADLLSSQNRRDDLHLLKDRTFLLVLECADGLNRSVKALSKQLAQQEAKA